MIKFDDGCVSYEGDKLGLNIELGIIIREMYQKGIVSREMLDVMVRGAVMNEHELREESEKALVENLSKRLDAISELSKILEELNDKKGDA